MRNWPRKLFHFILTEVEGLLHTYDVSREARLAYNKVKNAASIDMIVGCYDLNFTKRVTGVSSDIDVKRTDLLHFFGDISTYCANQNLQIHLLLPGGKWRCVSGKRLGFWLRCLSSNQPTQMAFVGANGELQKRLSINIWKLSGEALGSIVSNAPVKKVLLHHGLPEDLASAPSDRSIGGIDAVYTWVNSDDPQWRKEFGKFRSAEEMDLDRYQQVDELKYSIRSLFMYAPWVERIFIFSNCQAPDWFVPSDNIQWVMHSDVIPSDKLPLFNSHAIETYLHEIPNLSERFIYFNDDVFLSSPVQPADFFTAYNQGVSRMESYGMVPFLANVVEEGNAAEWQHAAVNASRLLYALNDLLPTRLHHHAPFSILKSVYCEMSARFPVEFEMTRKARFRSSADYSFTSFFYHHFALARGKAQHIAEGSYIVKSSNYLRFYLGGKGKTTRFFCINDGGGGTKNKHFMAFKRWYLEKRFPFKSPAER